MLSVLLLGWSGACCLSSTTIEYILSCGCCTFFHHCLVPPDAASVILRARDYRIAGVIKGTRKYIILVTVQYLLLHARVSVPHSARLITARRDDLVALRVELDFRYLIFVPLQQSSASSCENVINPCKTVSRGCGQFVTSAVESCI